MEEKVKTGQRRPPVVTVMGHVDHGKTTLLDYIRKSRVVEKEHGGITQHIGAYQVVVGKRDDKRPVGERTITFIDTPGHAAFVKMRERGSRVADLVVLVIAANDGVKPQTEESLKHIGKAGVPFVVAANKIDLPGADVEKIKDQLVKLGYLPEDRGGKLVVVPVSATKGQGVEQLLEMVLLVAGMENLKSDLKATVRAEVIESKLDQKRGPVATVIVGQGTLRVGQGVYLGEEKVKVRALFDEQGKLVKEALPSQPVEMLGFSGVPEVGSVICGEVHLAEVSAQEMVKSVSGELTDPLAGKLVERLEVLPKGEQLPIILKVDAVGSLEAVEGSLDVHVRVVNSGVGGISESDVMLARATGAQIVGFGVELSSSAAKLAELEKVVVKTYKVIYELLEDLEEQVKYLLDPRAGEEVVGRAKILAEFNHKGRRVAGAKVTEGKIDRQLRVRVVRGSEEVGEARVKSLRQGKEDKLVVKKGEEFGAVFSPAIDFLKGDVIIAYKRKNNS